MADIVQIPLSNTLRLVRTDNRSGQLQNFDNTLLQDEVHEDYNDRPYYQKINGTDTILIQFATDATTIKAEIFDLSDELVSDISGSISTVQTSTSFTVYDLSFSVAAEGFYYLKMTFDTTETHQSENFQIDGFETRRMIKIEYNTDENDGIIYNDNQTFVVNIEGRIVEYEPGQDKEVYENFNKSLVNLNSYPTRTMTFEYGFIPRYMVEKLNLALAHEVFKANDVEHQSIEGLESDFMRAAVVVTNMYKGDVKLRQVIYEDYESVSDDVAPTTNHILIDESGGKSIMLEGGINYFNRYKD